MAKTFNTKMNKILKISSETCLHWLRAFAALVNKVVIMHV